MMAYQVGIRGLKSSFPNIEKLKVNSMDRDAFLYLGSTQQLAGTY